MSQLSLTNKVVTFNSELFIQNRVLNVGTMTPFQHTI